MSKKIDITYMAFSKVHYDSFDYETPFGEVHNKLYERCQTYHITSVHYRDPKNNPVLEPKISWLKKLLTPKK